MHWIYLIHEFHNLSLITEINELFHNILIYWDAPVSVFTGIFNQLNASFMNKSNTFFKKNILLIPNS